MLLPSTKILVLKLRKSMGDYAFVRYCRNIGISFEDCHLYMFGTLPVEV